MENIAVILGILTIHFLAWLTPGPLYILIIRNSMIYSRKIGFWTALGILFGNLTHILISITGIFSIISKVDNALNVIKIIGVGYITFLGIKTMFTSSKDSSIDYQKKSKESISNLEALKTGYLTNMLSPKALLFFASIFAALISSQRPKWVIGALIILMPLNAFMMANLISIVFTQKKIRIVYSKYSYVINKILGGLLILLALIMLIKS